MELGAVCSRCQELAQAIRRYLDGEDRLFIPRSLGTLERLGVQASCSLCEFLQTACQQMSPRASTPRSQITCEIRANNDGTLYLDQTPSSAQQRVYLLPLQPPEAGAHGRRLHGQCDPSLLRSWLVSCQAWHGPNCYTPGWAEVIAPLASIDLRVIDLSRQSLVRAPANCRHVALSYVWGKDKVFQTTRSNVAELQEAGGIGRAMIRIPKTIADAMKLVETIGEQYLWVDSLCIWQCQH